ncbi:hypothetical protein F3K46_09470 [Thermoanaerobacterium thermosaccharolyticum]|nr:hypothetical protein [Thermoanaerobacterium thermosaccharolyticum]MBE0228086.1 hypothetical protein [Thermoanaerobacterium thermosaccharolyticum]
MEKGKETKDILVVDDSVLIRLMVIGMFMASGALPYHLGRVSQQAPLPELLLEPFFSEVIVLRL